MPKLDFEIARDLQAAGASQELAEAVVRAISERQTANLSTKSDVVGLRTELIETREALRSEIAAIRAVMATKEELAETREVLRSEMAALELRLTEKMATLHTKIIIWLVGTAIASVTLVAAIGQLLK